MMFKLQLVFVITLATFNYINEVSGQEKPKEEKGTVASPPAGTFQTFSEPADLVVLTKDNYDTEMKAKEWTMVMFFAPWITCECCIKTCAAYKETATALKSKNLPITLAVFDCTTDKAKCDAVKVGGLPVLKIFQKGEYYSNYESASTLKETFTNFIEYLVKPAGESGATASTPQKASETPTETPKEAPKETPTPP